MAKHLTLSKIWYTREDAEEYGTVEGEQDGSNVWTVTFPDDPGGVGEMESWRAEGVKAARGVDNGPEDDAFPDEHPEPPPMDNDKGKREEAWEEHGKPAGTPGKGPRT